MGMRRHVIGWLSMVCFVMFTAGGAANAAGLDLVGLLTQNLGVTTPQAQGGAGAIFNTASQKMSVDDFTTVTNALPEVKSLLKTAPAAGSGSGTLGGLSAALGSSGGSLGTFAGLADTFTKLGLSSDMVAKFIPIVLEYAQSKGGEDVASLLRMALQ